MRMLEFSDRLFYLRTLWISIIHHYRQSLHFHSSLSKCSNRVSKMIAVFCLFKCLLYKILINRRLAKLLGPMPHLHRTVVANAGRMSMWHRPERFPMFLSFYLTHHSVRILSPLFCHLYRSLQHERYSLHKCSICLVVCSLKQQLYSICFDLPCALCSICFQCNR